MFKLYFQSRREVRKQKEAGVTIESSGMEERRKMFNSEATRQVGTTTRRVHTKVREEIREVLAAYEFNKGTRRVGGLLDE